jgi:hypothetical protein
MFAFVPLASPLCTHLPPRLKRCNKIREGGRIFLVIAVACHACLPASLPHQLIFFGHRVRNLAARNAEVNPFFIAFMCLIERMNRYKADCNYICCWK